VGSQGRVFLQLEALELRDQPDATPLALPVSPLTNPGVLAPTPPAITKFAAENFGNGRFLITGQVVDVNPAGLTVTFGGSTSASGLTVTTNADGTFSKVIQLRTDGTDGGYLTATTVDSNGLSSQAVQVLLNPNSTNLAPVAPAIINFTAKELNNGKFVITGQVVDATPGGLTITCGGETSASGMTTTTNADGTFSLTVQLRTDGTDCGYLTATTVDGNGLSSSPVQVYLDPTCS
jgi:phage-related tail fiber protein